MSQISNRHAPRDTTPRHAPRDVTPRRSSVGTANSDALGRTPRSSSNAFACGTNPNAGNLLTERRSSRVSAPAGGRSSFDFGWDYDPQLEANGNREVEGSQPRKWKPCRAPMEPPGGAQTAGKKRDDVSGRKLFPDMGAGNNRDAHAIEALRYYQESERLGKHSVPKQSATATKHARDSHRYYLGEDGITPGKARHQQRPASPSTSAGSSDCQQSESDSLPLGAEWSTFPFRAHSMTRHNSMCW